MFFPTPSDVADWICGTLEMSCSQNSTFIYLKPIYHTLCFFYKGLCGTEEINERAAVAPAKKDPVFIGFKDAGSKSLSEEFKLSEESKPLEYDFFRNWRKMELGPNRFEEINQPSANFISLGLFEFAALVVFLTSIIFALSYVVVLKKHHKTAEKKVRVIENLKNIKTKYGNNHFVKPDNHWINRDQISQTRHTLSLSDETVRTLLQKQAYLEDDINKLVTNCKDFEAEIKTIQQKYHSTMEKLLNADTKLKQTCFLHQKEVADLNQRLQKLQNERLHLENMLKPEKLESNGRDFCTNMPDKSVLTVDQHVHDSLEKLEDIYKEIEELKKKVETFRETQKNKSFLHLEELLVRSAVKLDDVESHGNMLVRLRRKALLDILNNCLSELRSKIEQ